MTVISLLLLLLFSIFLSPINAKDQKEDVPGPLIQHQIFDQPVVNSLQKDSDIIILSVGNNISVSSNLGSDSFKFINLTTYFESEKDLLMEGDNNTPIILSRIQFNNDKTRIYAIVDGLNYTLISKNLGSSWKLIKLPASVIELSFNNYLRNNFITDISGDEAGAESNTNNKAAGANHAIFLSGTINEKKESLYYSVTDEQGFKNIEPLQYSRKCILLQETTTICISEEGNLVKRLTFPSKKDDNENSDMEVIPDVSNINHLQVHNGYIIAVSKFHLYMSVDGNHWHNTEIAKSLSLENDVPLRIMTGSPHDDILLLDEKENSVYKIKYNLKKQQISIRKSIRYQSSDIRNSFFVSEYGSDVIVDNKISNDNGDSWSVIPEHADIVADFIPSAALFVSSKKGDLYISLLNNDTEFHNVDSFQKITPAGSSKLIFSQFINNGSVIIAINDEKKLFYSFDFGKIWKSTLLIQDKIGNNEKYNSKDIKVNKIFTFQNKVLVYFSTMDFIQFTFDNLQRKCAIKSQDFEYIDFHHNSRCYSGVYHSYLRKATDSLCALDSKATPLMSTHPCNCTISDYECAPGFQLDKSWNCVPENDEDGNFIDSKILEYTSEYTSIICENEKSFFKPSGYILKYGNQCENGLQVKDFMEVECVHETNLMNDGDTHKPDENHDMNEDDSDEESTGEDEKNQVVERDEVNIPKFVDENEKVKPRNPVSQSIKNSNFDMLDYYNFTVPGKIIRHNILKLSTRSYITDEDEDEDEDDIALKDPDNIYYDSNDELIMLLTDRNEFYFSTNYGKSFKVFKSISGYHIQDQTISLVHIDSKIIYSSDQCKNWRSFNIPPTRKQDVIEISFHETFFNWVIVTIKENNPDVAVSYISLNLGSDWFILKRNVIIPTANTSDSMKSCFFAANHLSHNAVSKSILCPLLFNDISKNNDITKRLVSSDDFFITSKSFLNNYKQFYMVKSPTFKSDILAVNYGHYEDNNVKFIKNNGKYRKSVAFPADFKFTDNGNMIILDNHFSSIIHNASMKLLYVDDHSDTGKLYKSNSNINKFVMAKNDVEINVNKVSSLEKVHHLDGILLVNEVISSQVYTEISFDDGVNWESLRVNADTICENCSLHLENLNKVSISSTYGAGLLLGIGNIGRYLNERSHSKTVFISVDGGVSWNETLNGGAEYDFVFLDHGSVIIISRDGHFFYSTNYGDSFNDIPFSIEPYKDILFMDTIRSDSSKKFVLVNEYNSGNFTELLFADFSKTLNRKCNFDPYIGSTDFELWKPWNPNYKQKGCLFGKQKQLYRKLNDSICSIDKTIPDEENGKVLEFCNCELNIDFECDTNFKLSDNGDQCKFMTQQLYASTFNSFSRSCQEFYSALYFDIPNGFRKNSISSGCLLTEEIKAQIKPERFECPNKAKQFKETKKGLVNAGVIFLFIVTILCGLLFIGLIVRENFYMYDNVVRLYIFFSRNSKSHICYYLIMQVVKPFVILYFMIIELIQESNARMEHRRYRRMN